MKGKVTASLVSLVFLAPGLACKTQTTPRPPEFEEGTFLLEAGEVFGRDSRTIEMVYEGKVDDGRILGIASNGEYRMHFRGTRVADLPRVAGG
jgi:hypothetical protein